MAMKLMENRFDASLLTEEERGLVGRLIDMARREKRPCLKAADGTEVPLPQAVHQLLMRVLQDLRRGRAVVLVPEDETFTTQAAANYLGMSRQFFVTLLESGKIPFHRVGTHRRVYFKDLLDYERKRDSARRAGLRGLFDEVDKAGLYDASYTGEDEG